MFLAIIYLHMYVRRTSAAQYFHDIKNIPLTITSLKVRFFIPLSDVRHSNDLRHRLGFFGSGVIQHSSP